MRKESPKAPSAPEALHPTQWFQCLCLSLVNPSHPVILATKRHTHIHTLSKDLSHVLSLNAAAACTVNQKIRHFGLNNKNITKCFCDYSIHEYHFMQFERPETEP